MSEHLESAVDNLDVAFAAIERSDTQAALGATARAANALTAAVQRLEAVVARHEKLAPR